MQNIKASVVSALKTATALHTLVEDRIYFHYPDSFSVLPCISYFEYNNSPALSADNVEIISEIIFQIDIWSNSSTSAIAQALETVMLAEEFVRLNAIDLFEIDTKTHHKSMKFVNKYADPIF